MSGIARSNGELFATGSSQGFEPAFIEPGEIGFGYVFFDADRDDEALIAALEYEFTIETSAPDSSFGSVGAAITELSQNGEELIGIATNETEGEIGGPASVGALCFNDDGTLGRTGLDFTDGGNDIAAGASVGFTIRVGEGCSRGLISVSGFAF